MSLNLLNRLTLLPALCFLLVSKRNRYASNLVSILVSILSRVSLLLLRGE